MKHHILAIGISKHQNPFINNLDYADKDAQDFYTLFTTNVPDIGYKKQLINSEATFTAIRTALGKELKDAVDKDDTFFFIFSGHGTTAEDQEGTSLAHYLIPFDATPDITNSAISVDYLRETFDNIPCKASFIFIDSCFSGAINSKGYTNPNKKDLKTIKKFTDQVFGDGSVIFTASKAGETALEDAENKNGLFTHYILKELQKNRETESYPVADIFTPVTEDVIRRASERYSHNQTPTLNVHFEGVIRLPVFRKPLKISPQLLQVPQYPQLALTPNRIPEIELSDKKQQKVINDLISFVISAKDEKSMAVQELIYERFCWKILKDLKQKWEQIFSETGSDVNKIPDAVANLEANSFQLVLLGCITSIFGTNKQMKIYSDAVLTTFEWEKGKAGLTALIAVPQILLVNIIYCVGIVCLARNKISPLAILLHSRVEDIENEDEQAPLFKYNYIHYCDAIGGGYATKVGDHIRELISTYSWIPELAPRINDKVLDYQLQVNFLLMMLSNIHNIRFFADFGRFYGNRIKSLINKIKYNQEMRAELSELFQVKPEDLSSVLYKKLSEAVEVGLGGGFFWQSVKPQALLTKSEIAKLRNEGQ